MQLFSNQDLVRIDALIETYNPLREAMAQAGLTLEAKALEQHLMDCEAEGLNDAVLGMVVGGLANGQFQAASSNPSTSTHGVTTNPYLQSLSQLSAQDLLQVLKQSLSQF
jgi:hypothetical protein